MIAPIAALLMFQAASTTPQAGQTVVVQQPLGSLAVAAIVTIAVTIGVILFTIRSTRISEVRKEVMDDNARGHREVMDDNARRHREVMDELRSLRGSVDQLRGPVEAIPAVVDKRVAEHQASCPGNGGGVKAMVVSGD